MTRILTSAFALAAGAGVLSLALAGQAQAEPVKITFLGVGDAYEFDADDGRGGFARLNAVARAERAANPNTLYLFDGDMLSPSLLSGFDGGAHLIELTNLEPFDLAVPGNHELDAGVPNFLLRVSESNYPWAAINMTQADGSSVPGLGGVMMKEIEGVKLALIPLAQDTTPEVVRDVGDLKFLPTVPTALDAAAKAREDGADLVVAVVQAPIDYDRELIESGEFDVIISGDDHSYGTFYDGKVAYVETSIDGRFLSPLDIYVEVGEDDGKREVEWTPIFRFIDTAAVEPDAASQAIVDRLNAELDASLNVELGVTEVELDSRRNTVRSMESNVGNLVADGMRAATGADVAITNGGGIRADRTYDPGTKILRRDILSELPFGNVTVMVEVNGDAIRAAIENGLSRLDGGPSGRFPHVSGMSYVFDPSAPAGSRVTEIKVGGADLVGDKLYKVALNDYMLGGGDGYGMLGAGKVLINTGNGNLMANDVMNYVAKLGTLTSGPEGRIKTVGQ